ncbi:ankyrin-2-like [Papaver somniferum]|uniref:ankyrin-2-like n=1 Tax=Papaver somniferum TaxID=3469 RepID=UPI000E6FBF83|nr:ankyrin-2-like [Papaver somniferum]
MANFFLFSFSSLVPQATNDPGCLPKSGSPHFELFNAAYTGKLHNFKSLASDLAKGEGIGVAEAIRKLVLENGKGFLHVAAAGGSLEVCKYLIENLKLDVDSKDGTGTTPLHHAAMKRHLETARYLLEKGANPEASDDTNATSLHFAALSGDTKIITLLLSRGVHVDVASTSGTALHFAAGTGHPDAVRVLLDHGANPDVVGFQGMFTPLISAIYAKSWECVKLLLQAGADPNAVAFGNTPLVVAARHGSVDVIKRLLEAGADPNYKMNLGMTALEVAAVKCKIQNVGVLFPVTSRIPTYPDWSIAGLLRDVELDANEMRREVHEKERFHQAISKGSDAFQGEQYLVAAQWFREAFTISPEDPAVLSNMSVCFAHLGDGNKALDFASKCVYEKPEWPEAYYRLGVALNMQKRCEDAADAFDKGLTLDPRNKELKDSYMKAMEARLNSVSLSRCKKTMPSNVMKALD